MCDCHKVWSSYWLSSEFFCWQGVQTRVSRGQERWDQTAARTAREGEEKAWNQKGKQSHHLWGNAVRQQVLGLQCQKGTGTSSGADAHSCYSGWCHGLGLWWWDEGIWGGKKILQGPPGKFLRHQSVLPAAYLITFAAKTIQLHCLIYSFPCLVATLKNNNNDEAVPVKPWVNPYRWAQWGAQLGAGMAAA